MQRSNFIIKIISAVIFAAILCYMFFSLVGALSKPLKTTIAVKGTFESSGPAIGYAVRDEHVIYSSGGNILLPSVKDGEKVAGGQTIAVEYSSESAVARTNEVQLLELRIEQLETMETNPASRIKAAEESVTALASAVQTGDLSTLEVLSLNAKGYIFKSEHYDNIDTELAILRSQLEELKSQTGDYTVISAPRGGTYCSFVDGFENIGPDLLDSLVPSSLNSLFDTPNAISNSAIGRIAEGIYWYYAAVMNTADAHMLEIGNTYTIEFIKADEKSLPMTLKCVGENENGKCVAVFSCKCGLASMISSRSLSANVIFNSYSGISVPADALYSDDTGDYVFTLVGLQAEQVYVDVLYNYEDKYIVKDASESGNTLREGSEIILDGKDLYDGKVVQ